MTKYFIPAILFTISIIYGCDGFLAVRGYIDESSNKSYIVSDSLFQDIHVTSTLKDAQIIINPFIEDSLIIEEDFERDGFILLTDSMGYFQGGTVVAPRSSGMAALIASSSGYLNDTIFFNYSSNGNL